MLSESISIDSVFQFLYRFEQLTATRDYSQISAMIHEHAFFRFNDGDFIGRDAVQSAFEKTWESGAGVENERYFLTDIVVLTTDCSSASATYTYNWEGVREGRAFSIQGRGTRVLLLEQGRLQIIHEHLSRFPK